MTLQAYIDAFRQLLDRLSQGDDEQAQQRLNSLLLELQSFIMIVPLLYPGRMKEFVSCRMDTGAACSEIPADNKPCLDDPHILVSNTLMYTFVRQVITCKPCPNGHARSL